MSGNRRRQVRKRVELLELTRAHDGQQAFNGALPMLASCAKHDFSPLNGRAQGSLGGIVRGRHALLVHEGEEVLIVHEEGVRQIADLGVGGIEMPLTERKEPSLDRPRFRDQLCPGQWGAPSGWISAEAMPQSE